MELFKWCWNLSAGTVLQGCSCLSGVETYLPALCCRGEAVNAVSKPICRNFAAGLQLFKRCQNLTALWCRGAGCLSSVGTYLPALCCKGAGCLNGVWTYLLGTVEQGYRLFKRCQFLPPEQVRLAELDILLYFYFRTDQVKPGHMQLLRSAFFFLLREIYSVRMSTSEFGSIILLNK